MLIFIQFIYGICPAVTDQMPAWRGKGELFQIGGKLFYRLCCDKAPDTFFANRQAIEFSVGFDDSPAFVQTMICPSP